MAVASMQTTIWTLSQKLREISSLAKKPNLHNNVESLQTVPVCKLALHKLGFEPSPGSVPG